MSLGYIYAKHPKTPLKTTYNCLKRREVTHLVCNTEKILILQDRVKANLLDQQ